MYILKFLLILVTMINISKCFLVNRRSATNTFKTNKNIKNYFQFFSTTALHQNNNNNNHDNNNNTSSSSSFLSNQTFESWNLNSKLLNNLKSNLKIEVPSQIQASSFSSLKEKRDLVIASETGSGKTLAYLLPLFQDILDAKQQNNDDDQYSFCRAIVLVPNKELVQQVLRMGEALLGDDLQKEINIVSLPGGLKSPEDFRPFRRRDGSHNIEEEEVMVDLLVTTPANLGPWALSPKHIDFFADVRTLVIDEADMLLDGGYIRALENVLMGFRRADRLDESYNVPKTQYAFVAATLPDYGLKSVDAYIDKKFPNINKIKMPGLHRARHYGLKEETTWIEFDNQNIEARSSDLAFILKNDLAGENKVMVFVNKASDADRACDTLRREGVDAVSYHAKLSMADKEDNLNTFRDSSTTDDSAPVVLVCTDLASRGLDIPGVTVVVQLQFATNVVAHLHRMGRCGRAGRRDGRGFIYYSPSSESTLVELVRAAETQQQKMTIEGDVIDPLDSHDDEAKSKATIQNAFSRKRGLSKKKKRNKKQQFSSS